MDKFKIQLQDIDGNVEEEKELSIGENDILIMQYPIDMKMETAHKIFKKLEKTISEGTMFGCPNNITFRIIKMSGENQNE